MKILFISMPSIHFIRWIQNLNETQNELYWFDVLNKGEFKGVTNVNQITNWKKRKFPRIKGEYVLSKKFPEIYAKLQPFLEVTINQKLEEIIQEIKPDLIHSFEMQSCSYPIFKTMNKFSHLKWLYSCWGSDLYYYQNDKEHYLKIKKLLNRINYLHTDCMRDFSIARQLNFKGKYLGVVPGGGGYDMIKYLKYRKPLDERNVIVVKGYQHKFGRAINIIKALGEIQKDLIGLQVVIFGAHKVVFDYIKKHNLPFVVYQKDTISHEEIIEIIGKSVLYIGNSISDGIPNTLLEAMFMGAFPIQSNPGGATAEIVNNGKNGFLIENTEDINHIQELILRSICDRKLAEKAFHENQKISQSYLDYHLNQQKIINIYKKIEAEI